MDPPPPLFVEGDPVGNSEETFWHEKTRICRLSCRVITLILPLAILVQCQLWRTDRQTGHMMTAWLHATTAHLVWMTKWPSLAGSGRLTTYWRTSSSFFKLNNLRILDARFGPRRRGIVTSVRPGISCSPVHYSHLVQQRKSQTQHLAANTPHTQHLTVILR